MRDSHIANQIASQVSQQQEQVQHNTSRREAVGMLATAAALLTAAPAQAFLGIGEPSENETYTADTVCVHPPDLRVP